MVLNQSKWITLIVALCFAILQALQPFIHGHLDGDHPIQDTGFHIGSEHEEADLANIDRHTVSDHAHTSQTVSVASGIKQDLNLALPTDSLSIVLLFLCFAIVLLSTLKSYKPLSLTPYQSLKRRLPAPRAPPQF